jgi:class 3 adenylate cyclase
MRRLRLRLKILLYTSVIVVALIGAMLAYVNWQAQQFVAENISAQLEQGRQRIGVIAGERVAGLRLTAQLVASFPELKALLATDAATIRDFLLAYQGENQRTELLIVLDSSGRVVARTDQREPAPIDQAAERWAQPALANQAATGLLETAGGAYDAAAVPASAGGTVFGFVIAGAKVDDAYARTLGAASEEQVAIAGPRSLLASTLPGASLPWQTLEDWNQMRAAAGTLRTAEVAGESYAALPFLLGTEEDRVLAVILQSRDAALAPYRRIQGGLAVVGLLVMAIGVGASVRMAQSVTAEIPKLVEGTARVAAGNFEQPIDVRSGDEIGDLAQSFNAMMRGLRERAAMQKFVSQSTIEMIRSEASADLALGRRVQLTVFFSDIRRFTELAERRAPEEVVRMLNACLSLQAEIVRKYDGDIDKYVGDCVVALFFGEEGASSAVQCAIEIEKALVQFHQKLPAGDRIEIGIGIATGEAVLGAIGSADRRDFTAIGSAVNLCSRLCARAGPGEILLAEPSYAKVRDRVQAERLEPLSVKGFSQPVPVYRIAYPRQQSTAAS